MNYCFIGFGEVGACALSLVNASRSACTLDVIDPSNEIYGRCLDARHAAAMQQNTFRWNHEKAIEEADVIFYSAGKCNPINTSRREVAADNLQLVQQIFGNKTVKNNCLIIVITNPVELVAAGIHHILRGKHHVVGTGTGLDTLRLECDIAVKLNRTNATIHCPVLGEHGELMYPVFSQLTIEGKPFVFSPEEEEQLRKELVLTARNIRKTEKATKYGIAQCALLLLNAWEGLASFDLPIALPVLDGSVYLNRMAHCSLGNFEVRELSLNEKERLDLQAIEDDLREQQQVIANLL